MLWRSIGSHCAGLMRYRSSPLILGMHCCLLFALLALYHAVWTFDADFLHAWRSGEVGTKGSCRDGKAFV